MPSWRWVFAIVALPGLVIGALILAVVREPQQISGTRAAEARGKQNWLGVLRSRNVILSVLGLLCAMCSVFVFGAMLPSYLIDALHLSRQQMGFVTFAIGFGGFIGQFSVAGLSDRLGRRTMGCVSFLASAFLLFLFSRTARTRSLCLLLWQQPWPNMFNILSPVMSWRETGTTPKQIVASVVDGNGVVTMTRPVFPYPAMEKYTGSGSTNDAANFVSSVPLSEPVGDFKSLGTPLYSHGYKANCTAAETNLTCIQGSAYQ